MKIFTNTFSDNFIKFYFQALLLLERSLRVRTSNQLSLREVMLLNILDRLSRTNQNTAMNIAKYLQVSPPIISQAIKSLVKKGYLMKRINHDDNRYFFLDLTEKGKQSNENSMAINHRLVSQGMKKVSPFDIKGIVKFFKISEELVDAENRILDEIESKKSDK